MDTSCSMDANEVNEKVTINCGGMRHETYSNTIKNIPDTRLYWIIENKHQLPEFDPNANEFFFDRHPGVFTQILNFYRTGRLHCPNDVCGPLFEEELAFWGIDEFQVESCCWLNYKKHREAQANLRAFEGTDSDGETVSDMDMTVYGLVASSIRNRNRSLWKKYQPKIWNTFEEPYSSRLAQVIAFTTLLLILTSVTTFCLETLPYFSDKNSVQNKALYVVEAVCVAWFTIEFFARLVFCPNKLNFVKQPMNWIDFGAVLPFYLEIFLTGSNIKTIVVLRVVRLIRVFRIFKLSRHSYGLQILGHTLKSSFSELFLLAFFLSIGVVIFSSVIYYAEKDVIGTKFKTIPHSFWWAVVTMTTLGYGDMVPETPPGQVVGSLCALCGVLMIALPVPVIVSNFSLYYSHAKAKLNLPKKRRQLIIGAANALRIAEPFGGSQASGNAELESPGSNSGSPSLCPSRRVSVGFSPVPSPSSSFRRLSVLAGAASAIVASPASSRASTFVQSPRDRRRGTIFAPETRETGFEMKEMRPLQQHPSSDHQEISQASHSCVTPETSGGHTIFTPLPVINQPSLSSKSSSRDSGSDARALRIDRRRSRSTSKSTSIESSQESPKQSRGRRGRRGSLYVVGFTAKHWQNKALKKRDRSDSTPHYPSTLLPSTFPMSPELRSLSCPAPGRQYPDSVEQSTEQETSGNSLASDNENEAVKDGSRNGSMETQTGKEGKKAPSSASSKRHKGDAYSNTKSMQTSLSVDSNDSSGKMSDDSLFVHEILRQRRGSSPLIRQKAVFTFDTSDHAEKVDTSAENLDTSRIKQPGHGSGDSSLHLTPVIEINGGEAEGRMDRSRGRRNSCIPAISHAADRHGNKSRSNSVSGCVNGSFEGDEGVGPSHSEPAIRRYRITSDLARDEVLKENLIESARPRSDSYPRYSSTYHDSVEPHLAGDVSPASDHSQRAYLSPESTLPSITEETDAKSETEAHQLSVSPRLSRVVSFPATSHGPVRPIVSRRPYSDSAFTDRRGSISPELRNAAFGDSSPRRTDSLRNSPRRSFDDPRNLGSPVLELAQRRQGKILYVQLPLPDVGTEMAGNGRQRDHRSSGAEGKLDSHDRDLGRRDMATSPFVFQNPGFFPSPDLPSSNSSEPHGVFFADQSNAGTSNRSSPDTSLPRNMSGSPRNTSRSPPNMSGSPRNVSGSPNSFLYSPSLKDSSTCTPVQSMTGSNQELENYSPRAYLDRHSYRPIGAGDRHVPANVGETFYNRQDDEALGRSRSPLVETDREVVLNGYMGGTYTRRPGSASDPRGQRARAMFFGDSGISSVGSASNTSISHSVDCDVDPRERRESVSSGNRVEVLNAIHESDKESTSFGPFQRSISRETSTKNGGSASGEVLQEQRGCDKDSFAAREVYESSLV